MPEFSRETLHAYLDDALDERESAAVEKALRDSEELRTRLAQARDERDRGEHSLGAIWRREGITCPARQTLNGHLHGLLEPDLDRYVAFHLDVIACPVCLANLEDLKEKRATDTGKRRKKIVDAGTGLLRANGKNEEPRAK
jgi:hypothetical protein